MGGLLRERPAGLRRGAGEEEGHGRGAREGVGSAGLEEAMRTDGPFLLRLRMEKNPLRGLSCSHLSLRPARDS